MESPVGTGMAIKKGVRTGVEKSMDPGRNQGMGASDTIGPILGNLTLYNCTLYTIFSLVNSSSKPNSK